MADRGNLFVVAAPSGAGKTSLVKALIESTQGITVSISHTTRPVRPGETHGINYYFVSKDEFQRMVDHDDFLEHATIFDNWYGTSKSWVEQTLNQGTDVILEIDWQGHQQIKKLFPESIGIFILPPSISALEERLIKRNQDHPDVIKKRLEDVRITTSHFGEFEYLVINDDFSMALESLQTIVMASRMLLKRQISKHRNLIADLA